jgi:1,4-alpha-glucan branching enzyme
MKSKKSQKSSVRIECRDGKAQQVCLAGSFNDWNPTAMPMLHISHDRWVKELSLPPGRYEYRLIVDGQWTCDPAAAEQVSNSYGEFNSVLNVPPKSAA